MEIRIHINTDNAAFEDDPGELRRVMEVALSMALPKTERSEQDICDAPDISKNLCDPNGNPVGTVRLVWPGKIRVKCGTCEWEGRHGELECYRYEDGAPAETEYARCPKCFDEDQIRTVR